MKTHKIIKTHGGKRAGAGNKPKYSEPTKTVAFRIPESKIPELKAIVSKFLKKCQITKI